MKAIICTKYGPPDVLKMVEIETPVPKDNQVLIKVYFTTVTVGDCRVRGFNVPPSFWLPARLAMGWTKPKQPILGTELSGVVEKVGKNVTKFKTGDAVFAYPGAMGGCYAEYVCLDEKAGIALKPQHLSFAQAAALTFGGNTAMYFLQKSKLAKGEKILIYGASGCVGSAAVQLAMYFGAEVTAVCSTRNMDLVKSIGAHEVIDYTQTDLSEIREKFDVVFDAVGKAGIAKSIRLIKPQGRFLHSVATPFTALKIRLLLLGSNIEFVGGDAKPDAGQIDFIKKLADEGFFKPVMDKEFRFDDIVAAHEYVDQGHKKGNVAIKVVDASSGLKIRKFFSERQIAGYTRFMHFHHPSPAPAVFSPGTDTDYCPAFPVAVWAVARTSRSKASFFESGCGPTSFPGWLHAAGGAPAW